MGINTKILDGAGSGREATVTENFALKVQNVPETSKGLPPDDLANIRLFRDFLKNGTSVNMNVNGAVTAQEFAISSQLNKTIWLTSVRFIFEDASMEMNTQDFRRFATATLAGVGLVNGLLFGSVQSGETTDLASEPIQIMGDFFTYADSYLNLINSVGAQEDFLSFDFNFEKPIVLAEGGNDKLYVLVRDDLTGINKFQVLVRGYQEFTT